MVKPPPALPSELKNLVSEMYQALVNEVTEEKVFPAPSLDKVVNDLSTYLNGAKG